MKAEWTNNDSLTTSQTTKAILVIDKMPKNCSDCWLHRNEYCDYEKVWEDICHNAEHECHVLSKTNYIKRPSWCPLKPMPQKREPKEEWLNEYNRDEFADGWNACIEEIENESKKCV